MHCMYYKYVFKERAQAAMPVHCAARTSRVAIYPLVSSKRTHCRGFES